MTASERAIIVESGRATMATERLPRGNIANRSVTAAGGAVDVPSSFKIEAGVGDIGLVLQTWRPGAWLRPAAAAGVIDFSVQADLVSGGFDQVAVADLADPLAIHIPVANGTSSPAACRFYSASGAVWKTTGCKLRSASDAEIVCECSHCTRFGGFLLKELREMPFKHFKDFEVDTFDGPTAAAFILLHFVMQLVGLVLWLLDNRCSRRGDRKLSARYAADVKAALADSVDVPSKMALIFAMKSRHALLRLCFYGAPRDLTTYQLWQHITYGTTY